MSALRRFHLAARLFPFPALALCGSVVAQTTPPPCCPGPECPSGKTIRIVVPFPAGGPTDIVARQLAEELRASIKDGQYVVENRPGAAGVVGAMSVAKADWRETILVANAQLAINPAILRSVPYTLGRDLLPVAGVSVSPLVIAAPAGRSINNLSQLIAAAKAKPGQLSIATTGSGSVGHLALEQLKQATGTDMTHVPYKGAGPAVTDLLGGQVDAAVLPFTSLRSHVQANKARLLGVFSEQRSPALPDVPTVSNVTHADVSAEDWIGVFAAADTPPECTKSLGRRIDRITRSPQFRSNLDRLGFGPATRDSETFAAQVRADTDRFAKAAKNAGIKAD